MPVYRTQQVYRPFSKLHLPPLPVRIAKRPVLPASTTPVTIMATIVHTADPDEMKTADLKAYLRARGLPVSGTKEVLIERVKGAIFLNLKENGETSGPENSSRTRLLTPLNENLPNPKDLQDGWVNVSEIPTFSEKDLYNYLVLDRKRTCDFEGIGARRALKARVFYEDGHVHSLAFHHVGDSISHVFVKAKCIPSYPSRNVKDRPDYSVWVCLSKRTGRVHSADCTCTAGMGESCNHIAATLYAMVDISQKRERGLLASTSQPCRWNRPRKRKLSPVRSMDVTFQKFEWKVAKKTTSAPKAPHDSVALTLDIDKFRKATEEALPQAAWLKNFPKAGPVAKENIILPELHNISFSYADFVDLSSLECLKTFDTYFDNLSTSASEAALIEEATRGQSASDDWMKCRVGRLTASSFGSVVRRQDTTAPDNLLKVLLCYVPRCETAAMKWGVQHEPIARDSYVTFQRNSHLPITVQECGLLISPSTPHLGASPDGLVYCPHCPQYNGILEIKCPYSFKHLSPNEAAKSRDFFCVLTNDGSVKLRRNHNYYYQIQGQLAISGRSWCDFVVWTTCGMSIERIHFDQNLWTQTMLPKLNNFYKTAVLPELFSTRVKRHLKLF